MTTDSLTVIHADTAAVAAAAIKADSLPATADSAAVRVFRPFRPSYPQGFADTTSLGAKAPDPMATYAVIESRGSFEPESNAKSPLHSTTTLTLLIVSFLLIAYSYRNGVGYFHRIVRGAWSVRRTVNHFDERTTNEHALLTALVAVSLIMESIIIYSAVDLHIPDLPAGSWAASVYGVIAAAAAFYVAQLISIFLIGYIFSEWRQTVLWLQGFNSTQILMGITITPVAVIMLFAPTHSVLLTLIAAGAYVIARVVFFVKSVRIFYGNIFQCVYFILYLCALEIAPLIFLYNREFFIYDSK